MKHFQHKDFNLAYEEYGSGKSTIIALHGFGRPVSDFQIFTPLLTENQRIISIRLFGHVNSDFPEDRLPNQPLSAEELVKLFEAFLQNESIQSFHLLGYSLGGKIAFTLLEFIQDKINDLILIAPDGLKQNPLHTFSSKTWIGKKLSKHLKDHPEPFFFVANALLKLKLVNPKIHRFAMRNMENQEVREMVYSVWLIYASIIPDAKRIVEQSALKERKLNLIFGDQDSVIPTHLAQKLNPEHNPQIKLYEINAGHLLMKPDTVDFIREKGIWFDS